MMTTKTLSYLLTLVLVVGYLKASPVQGGENAISPRVAEKFGTVIEIEAEFVDKLNTYYDQNIVKEPFALKVLSVNGKVLKTPIEIEYGYSGKQRIAMRVKYRFNAFETIYTDGLPAKWDDLPFQIPYMILHKLMIKDAQTASGGK